MASTNWDTDRKRRRPPAWDPPKLLLVVVSGLHVVVGTSSVVGVVVDVVDHRGSIDLEVYRREEGGEIVNIKQT